MNMGLTAPLRIRNVSVCNTGSSHVMVEFQHFLFGYIGVPSQPPSPLRRQPFCVLEGMGEDVRSSA